MSRLTQFRALLKRAAASDPAPVAEATDDRAEAATELAAAEAAVADAERAYSDGLLAVAVPDGELRGLDDARRAASIRLDRARALAARMAERVKEAQEAERQAETVRLVRDADEKAAAFQRLAEQLLPEMGRQGRELMRSWAIAALAAEAANKATGGERRPSLEAFRSCGGRPVKVLAEKEVDLWTDSRGEAVDYQDEIQKLPDGSGMLMLPLASHSHRFSFKRTFVRTVTLPEEKPRVAQPLPLELSIPGMTADDAPGWVSVKPSPAAVLQMLDRLERFRDPEPDSRQPETTLKPVGSVRPVADPLTRHERMVENVAAASHALHQR